MRKLSAHYIFPSGREPLKYGIIILDNDGTIADIIDTGGTLREESNLEFYPGILTPGFVNAHCHLELSHMKGIIPRDKGMTGFIKNISTGRISAGKEIMKAIEHYAFELYRTGTSAVGDIVNTDYSISSKQKSPAYWHSFVELFSLIPENAGKIWEKGKELQKEFRNAGLSASISPHAPYSVSKDLWKLFGELSPDSLSIHNQESEDEEYLMCMRKGRMAEWFEEQGYSLDNLPGQRRSSLEAYIDYLPEAQRVLFVHNTFSAEKDFDLALKRFGNHRVFWVTCPRANLYITGRLPRDLFENRERLNICIGTDSLASNSALSMIEEMRAIQDNLPGISLGELIKWSTINGARALGIDNSYGSFEKGKKPGVVWINNISFPELRLTGQSKSKRLV
jgi:cytosine/adenosine deaminase-related metal-dependent hydrolase